MSEKFEKRREISNKIGWMLKKGGKKLGKWREIDINLWNFFNCKKVEIKLQDLWKYVTKYEKSGSIFEENGEIWKKVAQNLKKMAEIF